MGRLGNREDSAGVSSVVRKVDDAVREGVIRAGIGADDTVVAAVSGGPDSSTMLTSLDTAARKMGFRLHVAHLIHDFRGPESQEDAAFVSRLSAQLGRECTVEEEIIGGYDPDDGVRAFEQTARDQRYGFLAKLADSVGAKTVAVGHTADDQAETVLLHIARGSGLHGARGMRELAAWPYPNATSARVWRPLLSLTRDETIAYCRDMDIEYRDDVTNYMRDFARNRVRLDLMPAIRENLNPQVSGALVRLARTADTQLEYLEGQIDALWPALVDDAATGGVETTVDASALRYSAGVVRLSRDVLRSVHDALRPLIFRRAWGHVSGDSRRLTEQHLAAMSAISVANTSGKSIDLPNGITLTTEHRWTVLSKVEESRCPYPSLRGEFRLTLPGGPVAIAVTKRDGWEITTESKRLTQGMPMATGGELSAYLWPGALAGGATVRTWEPGDRIQPLGMSGSRKMQDVFTDAHVPRDCRDRVPLLVTPQGIAWAVGLRIAGWAAMPEAKTEDARAATLIRFELEGSRRVDQA
jgi:tRNA(Ile)-lysidine synthase